MNGRAVSYTHLTITYPSTGVYDNVVLFFQSAMEELGIEIKTNPIDLMAVSYTHLRGQGPQNHQAGGLYRQRDGKNRQQIHQDLSLIHI